MNRPLVALVLWWLLAGCTAVPDAEISTAVPTRTPMVEVTAATTAAPTQTSLPIRPSPTAVPLLQTYQDELNGFSFQYPAHWVVAPGDNIVRVIHSDTHIALRIRFKLVEEELPLTPSGVSAGDLVNEGQIPFLGEMVTKNVLIYQGKDKAVLYDNLDELPRGSLIFSLQVASNDDNYEVIDIPDAIQMEADAIIASFVMTDTAVIPLPQITSHTMSNLEYGVTWDIPIDWVEVTAHWPSPDPEILFWGVWSNQAEAADLLTLLPIFAADSLMVATIQIEPVSDVPSLDAATTTRWGQTVYLRELSGETASPFAQRWQATAVRAPYQYILTFGCIPPALDGQESNDFCRHYWDSVSFGFGLCVVAEEPTSAVAAWQTITDDAYGYTFEIPSTWVAVPTAAGDSAIFLSHPVHQQPISGCPLPEGFMKVDFFVNPQLDPDVAATFTAVSPIQGYPAWTRQPEDGEGGSFSAASKDLLIQGTQNRYLTVFYCSPTWSEACEAVYFHLIDSLSIE